MDKVEALLAKGSRPGPAPRQEIRSSRGSVRYPFYPALFPRVARGSDPAPDPDPVSLSRSSRTGGRERGGCHIRHAVDSRRARRPRRRGRGAPALRDGRRRSTVSARYTAHRGGERGPPHEREVARGVRAMRSRPTAAELELSVRAPPAERRRADAGGEARGRRARGSPSFARRQPERRRARNVRHPAHGRRHLRPRGRPRATSHCRGGRRGGRAVGRPHGTGGRRRERIGRGATMLRDFTENRRRRQLCLRGGGWATPGLRRRPRRRRAHGLRHGPSPRRLRRRSEPAREKHGHQGCQVETSRRRARPLGRRRRRAKTRQHATHRRRRLHQRAAKRRVQENASARARPREAEGSPAASRRGRATRHRVAKTLLPAPTTARSSIPRRYTWRRWAEPWTSSIYPRKRRGRQRARAERTPRRWKPPRGTPPTSSHLSGTTTPRNPPSDPIRTEVVDEAARVMARAATRSKTDPPPRTRLGLGRRLIRTRTIPKPPTTISRQWRRFATPRVPFAR